MNATTADTGVPSPVMKPYLIDKPLGATPLQALSLFRHERELSADVKLSYAGRLDPLATGLLPLLHGEQLQRQEDFWYLPKQYQVSLLLGIRTDSYDLLGIPSSGNVNAPVSERITAVIRGMVGKIDLSVPLYSSHRVEGKPMFMWAKSTSAEPVVIPVRRMAISQIDITGMSEIHSEDVLRVALERIASVQGDFRQDEISTAWKQLLYEEQVFALVHADIHCGSGTYIRSVVHEIGRRLGCGALVADLRRLRVGSWRVDDPDVTHLAWPQ